MNLTKLKAPTRQPLTKIPFWLTFKDIMKINNCEKSKAFNLIKTFKETHGNKWEEMHIESEEFLKFNDGAYTEELILRALNH